MELTILTSTVQGGKWREKMVGLIAVVTCSFILGNKEGFSDKYLSRDLPEGSQGANYAGGGRSSRQREE